ncbi:MAG TPA: hypothetical protein VGB45_07035 [Abditibacterium sp.]|jgi:hypothetical protein
MTSLSTSQIWTRFALACALTTPICLALAWILIRVTGVPPTYPPLLPQQIIAGTVGGALLVTLGFWILQSAIRDPKTRNWVFVSLGILLMIASYHLPYRLSYTKSPRFAGVTVAAQWGQVFLHTVVVLGSMFPFLRR